METAKYFCWVLDTSMNVVISLVLLLGVISWSFMITALVRSVATWYR